MKHHLVSLLLFVVAVVAGCSCLVQPVPITVTGSTEPSLVERITDATVVLSHDHNLSCAGVWIGQSHILTAAHCTDPEDGPVTYSVRGEVHYGEDVVVDKDHTAIVIARDPKLDLALISVGSDAPAHAVARLSIMQPLPGLHVNVMGHTGGYPYSYSPGWIGAVWHDLYGPGPIRGEFVQIWSGTWGGNSGGGMFDDDGYLLGICSFRTTGAPLTFFVSPATVATFLEKNS